MTAGLGVTAWGANIVATAAGTVPSYLLMRRWVWAVSGSIDLRREVVPFWALSFAGLVLSTLAVAVADRIATGMGVDTTPHTIALWTANVGSFAVLWVAQYLLLDRVLFGPRSTDAGGDAGAHGHPAAMLVSAWTSAGSAVRPYFSFTNVHSPAY